MTHKVSDNDNECLGVLGHFQAGRHDQKYFCKCQTQERPHFGYSPCVNAVTCRYEFWLDFEFAITTVYVLNCYVRTSHGVVIERHSVGGCHREVEA